MAIPGRKPQEQSRTRHKLTHDWVEVLDVPYGGAVPVKLPARRTIATRSGPKSVPVSAEAKRWWGVVRAMPHCVLWSPSDWEYALETALIADVAATGVIGAATELGQREQVLGMTVEARRGQRIRYVAHVEDEQSERDADIADLVEFQRSRRERLTRDDA